MLKHLLYAMALSAAVVLSGCGGGRGLGSSTSLPSTASATVGGASMPAVTAVATAKTTFSVTVPTSSASTPGGTKTLYFSLEDSPGHGNAAYSYTFPVDATHCTAAGSGSGESCSYSAAVPIGSDAFSILTTDAKGIPLGYDPYVNGSVKSDGTGLIAGVFVLSPIVAKAVSTYKFGPYGEYPQPPQILAGVTTSVYDADGDLLGNFPTSNAPIGNTYGSYTISQDVNEFSVEYFDDQAAYHESAAEQTQTITEPSESPVVVELPSNSAGPYTAHITTTTPVTSFTQAEFPQLTTTATVPASSTSFALTCQFPNSAPTSDPC
jgi:hypothetical protein